MATRVHLLLAGEGDKKDFGKALGKTRCLPLEKSGPWCWTCSSPWVEDHKAVRDAGLHAGKPFLLFTTFDGDGWELTTCDAGSNVANATHTFGDDWQTNNRSADTRIRKLAEMLKAIAPEVDSYALVQTLSGKNLGKAESGSDLGDLPRLLHILGATDIVEIPRDAPSVKENPSKPTRALALLKGHEGRAHSKITGVSMPIDRASDLAALALFCDPDVQLALIATGDKLPPVKLTVPCKISVVNDSVYVEADGGIGLKLNVIHRAIGQVSKSKGLRELTIVAGKSRGGKDISWHRYAGSISGDRFQIEQSTPAVDAAALKAALDLIGLRGITEPISCDSEEEATRIAARCAKSLYLLPEQAPKVKGSRLVTVADARLYVIMEVFRGRFGSTWDASAAQKAEAAEMRAWNRLEERLQTIQDAHRGRSGAW